MNVRRHCVGQRVIKSGTTDGLLAVRDLPAQWHTHMGKGKYQLEGRTEMWPKPAFYLRSAFLLRRESSSVTRAIAASSSLPARKAKFAITLRSTKRITVTSASSATL